MFLTLPPLLPSDFTTVVVGEGFTLALSSFGSYITLIIGVIIFGLVVSIVVDILSSNNKK